jgi:hypothetical protein
MKALNGIRCEIRREQGPDTPDVYRAGRRIVLAVLSVAYNQFIMLPQ